MATLHAAVAAPAAGAGAVAVAGAGTGEASWWACIKGAPESVLQRCVPGPARDEALASAQAWAVQGLRVLAVARREGTAAELDSVLALDADSFERDLTLLGLVGLIDPPRPEARAAVAECRAAGIRPLMITGDHPATALAIARDLGTAGSDADTVLTGAELARLDDAALAAAVPLLPIHIL